MRTPAQMAEDINNLNCHAGGGGYGPVTVAQMEAIYKEARKIEWTDKKPDREGWWWSRTYWGAVPVIVKVKFSTEGFVELRSREWISVESLDYEWSTRPIDMPDEARKELSK